MTREERILVLVWSLPDALPAPASWTGSLTRGQPRAPAPTRWAVCPGCNGDGVTLDKFRHTQTCETCDGAGRFLVDPYVERRVSGEDSPALARVEVAGCEWCQEAPRSRWDEQRGTWLPLPERFDRLPRGSGVRAGQRCDACGGSGWRPVVAGVDARVNGSSVERIAYRLPGPYRELEDALWEAAPAWRRALVRAANDPGAPRTTLAYGNALLFVSPRLPDRISLAAGVVEAWRAREDRRWRPVATGGTVRDQRIRHLVVVDGEPIARVARRSGLSERRVRQIAYGR